MINLTGVKPGHNRPMSSAGSTRAIVAAMAANAGIALAKLLAFLVTGSASLLAESIHSVADTCNQGLLLLGGRKAARVANDRHQFGYGRERFFWAFVVAMVLFTLGGVFSIYEGLDKIANPHAIGSPAWALGVLLFAMLAETVSLRTAVREARPVKGDRSWLRFITAARTPELPVVLLEDAGALVGLTLALAGVGLTVASGDPIWDGLATLSIGVLLLIISIVLTAEMKSLLIGEAATEEDVAALLTAAEGVKTVTRVIDLRTQHIGPEELLVVGKIEFDRSLGNQRLSMAIDETEAALRHAVPLSMQIYLEPDLYDPGRGAEP